MWQAGPSCVTNASKQSRSQSIRNSTSRCRWPELSPFTQNPASNQPRDHLDFANGEDNANFIDASANGFIMGPVRDTNGRLIVNDRLVVITRDELLAVTEKRIAAEVRNCLIAAAEWNNDIFPAPAPLDAPDNLGTPGTLFGRVPLTRLHHHGDALALLPLLPKADAVVAAPVLLAASFAFEGDVVAKAMSASWLVWTTIVWAGLASTVGATALLFWLVQRREPGRVTPWFLLTPLVSCGIGIGLMGDTLTLQLVLGGGATLVGVALVALSERRAAARAAADRQIQT